MRSLIEQLRTQLNTAPDRLPVLPLIIAVCLFLAPFAMLWRGFVDVFVSMAAATFLLRSILERDFRWLREPWVVVAMVLWAYLIARGLLSVDPERSALKALGWIRFIVLGCAIQFVLARSPAARSLLLYSILTMLVFGAGDALFQYVVGHDIFGMPMHDGTRLTGPSHNPAIGFTMVIVGMSAMAYLWRRVATSETLASSISPGGALAMVICAVFLSGERLAFLQAITATILLPFIMRVPVKSTLGPVALAAMLGTGFLVTSNASILTRQISTVTEVSKGGEWVYLRTMRSGIEVIRDHPVFGVGLKNFQASCAASAPVADVGDACELIHPHQIWLHITAETGLVGLAAFLAIFVLALAPTFRAFKHWADEPLLAGSAISIMFLMAPFTPSGNFFANFKESVFWFTLGTAAAMGRIVLAHHAGNEGRSHTSVPA